MNDLARVVADSFFKARNTGLYIEDNSDFSGWIYLQYVSIRLHTKAYMEATDSTDMSRRLKKWQLYCAEIMRQIYINRCMRND